MPEEVVEVEDAEDDVSKDERLKEIAKSVENQLAHIPKNQFCKMCMRCKACKRLSLEQGKDLLSGKVEVRPQTAMTIYQDNEIRYALAELKRKGRSS